ncbi:sensor domain-containing diguanylate cyclase [Marilutibacter chinensis]|uniref:diguanylate cyclase n=1 Tax=Marilutibacter chinensis TaxID=2912247 RepID=A0ABS9HWU8_9GAMM|nr:diguanylate cyclase [Lysobacter chinensis]MCF7223364.1 diguanylate cyclase [Lysobacter chinensis]
MVSPGQSWSLRRRFTQLLLFAALVPALLFSGVMLWQQYQSEHRSLGEQTGLSASLTASSIDDFIHSRLAGMAMLAQNRGNGSDDWSADLDSLLAAYPGLISALVTDRDGRIIAHAPSTVVMQRDDAPRSVADREYFRNPERHLRPYVSNAFQGRALGEDPLVAISAPIIRNGDFNGIVEASIHVETFVDQRGDVFRSRGYEMLLLDRRGRIIHATEGLPYRFLDIVDDPRLTLQGEVPLHLARTSFERRILGDGNAFVSRSRMRSGWTLVLLAPDRQLLETISRNTLVLVALLILISLGVLAATWAQLRALASGTGRLLDALRNFAVGAPVDRDGTDRMPMELQPVADAVSELSDRLSRAYGELNASLDEQRRLAASLQTVIEERDDEIAARTADLRQAVEELERVASIDALTGALNVRGFRRAVNALVEEPEYDDTSIAALIVDVDHFKAYNDRYGHPAGDTVLKRVVGIMTSLLRGPGDVLARVGGEEFAILLCDADEGIATEVAQRLSSNVRNTGIPHADGIHGVVTISIGVAVQPSPQFMDRLLSQADEALYRAKRNGRDRVGV